MNNITKGLFCAGMLALASAYSEDDFVLFETFESITGLGAFVPSSASEYNAQSLAIERSHVFKNDGSDHGIVLKDPAKRYAFTAKFDEPVDLSTGELLVIQYEVQLQDGLECGGAYVKAYNAEGLDVNNVTPSTPYVIMFGPDRCGDTTNKVHLIFNVFNPVTGKYEEKHLTDAPPIATDTMSHLYTLFLDPKEATYTIFVDSMEVRSGTLLEDFDPPFLPPKEIDDPTDEKPEDWVDDATIPDPDAKKPEDWDETAPAHIPDPNAVMPEGWLVNEEKYIPDPNYTKPEEWDDEEDGLWEAPRVPNPRCEEAPGCGKWEPPLIPNPAYKGVWKHPRIPNPEYKGEWSPRKIPNPDYYEDEHPGHLAPSKIGGLGVEVWTMQANILFDNFLVTRSAAVANDISEQYWSPKHLNQARQLENSQAFGGGTWQDKIVQFATEIEYLAGAFPKAAIAVVVLTLITLFASCYTCYTVFKSDTLDDEEYTAPRVNAAGAEISDDEDDEVSPFLKEYSERMRKSSDDEAPVPTVTESQQDSTEQQEEEQQEEEQVQQPEPQPIPSKEKEPKSKARRRRRA